MKRFYLSLLVASLLGALLARWPSFSGWRVTTDEAIYAVQSQAWRQGVLPYRDLWDNKPPGILCLFAIFCHDKLGGLVGVRLVGTLCVFLTWILVYHLAVQSFDSYVALWAAILYAFLSMRLFGVETTMTINTEIPQILFFTASMFLLLRAHRKSGCARVNLVAAGFMLGIAAQFRQAALVTAAPPLLYAFILFLRTSAWQMVGVFLLGFTGSLLPLIFWCLHHGIIRDFFWCTWAYPKEIRLPFFYKGLKVWGAFIGRHLPLVVLTGWTLHRWFARPSEDGEKEGDKQVKTFLVLWMLGAVVSVCLTGWYWRHYFFELQVPLAVTAGWGVTRVWKGNLIPAKRTLAMLFALYIVLQSTVGLALSYQNFYSSPSDQELRSLRAFLLHCMQPGEGLAVLSYRPELYYGLPALPPFRDLTPYPWMKPSFLLTHPRLPHPQEALKLFLQDSLRSQPQWVILRRQPYYFFLDLQRDIQGRQRLYEVHQEFKRYVAGGYVLVKATKNWLLYRHHPNAPAQSSLQRWPSSMSIGE